jgi:hypothetical protein
VVPAGTIADEVSSAVAVVAVIDVDAIPNVDISVVDGVVISSANDRSVIVPRKSIATAADDRTISAGTRTKLFTTTARAGAISTTCKSGAITATTTWSKLFTTPSCARTIATSGKARAVTAAAAGTELLATSPCAGAIGVAKTWAIATRARAVACSSPCAGQRRSITAAEVGTIRICHSARGERRPIDRIDVIWLMQGRAIRRAGATDASGSRTGLRQIGPAAA